MDEYQLPSDFSEEKAHDFSEEPLENLKHQSLEDEVLDFFIGLNRNEKDFMDRYVEANKQSNINMESLKMALNSFRVSKAESLKPSLEVQLANATFEEKGKILAEAGLNPLERNPMRIVPDSETSNEISFDGGIMTTYVPGDTYVQDLIEEIESKPNPVSDALKQEEKSRLNTKTAKEWMAEREEGEKKLIEAGYLPKPSKDKTHKML